MAQVDLSMSKEQAAALQELMSAVQQHGGTMSAHPIQPTTEAGDAVLYFTPEFLIHATFAFASVKAASIFLNACSNLIGALAQLKAVDKMVIKVEGVGEVEGHSSNLNKMLDAVEKLKDHSAA